MNNFTSGHSLPSFIKEASQDEGEQQFNQSPTNIDQDYSFVKSELDKLNFSPRKQSLEKILKYSSQKKKLGQHNH